jgi:hypothetical protein
MVGHAHPSALPDVRPDLQLAGPAQPLGSVQGRRAARPAARGCGAAPSPAEAPAGLGRPGGPGRADPGPPGPVPQAPAGHTRNRPAVAPPPDRPEMDLPAPEGRPPVSAEIAALIERPATENRSWGTSGSRVSCSSSVTGSAHPPSAGYSGPCGSRRCRRGIPTRPGSSSCPRMHAAHGGPCRSTMRRQAQHAACPAAPGRAPRQDW